MVGVSQTTLLDQTRSHLVYQLWCFAFFRFCNSFCVNLAVFNTNPEEKNAIAETSSKYLFSFSLKVLQTSSISIFQMASLQLLTLAYKTAYCES